METYLLLPSLCLLGEASTEEVPIALVVLSAGSLVALLLLLVNCVTCCKEQEINFKVSAGSINGGIPFGLVSVSDSHLGSRLSPWFLTLMKITRVWSLSFPRATEWPNNVAFFLSTWFSPSVAVAASLYFEPVCKAIKNMESLGRAWVWCSNLLSCSA